MTDTGSRVRKRGESRFTNDERPRAGQHLKEHLTDWNGDRADRRGDDGLKSDRAIPAGSGRRHQRQETRSAGRR